MGSALSDDSSLQKSALSSAEDASFEEPPLVIIAHASVGSGHRSAAMAIAQAMNELRGQHENLPANTEIAVVDILDYGGIRFSGEKTASLFTGLMSPIYDITWHYFLTGKFLWGGGFGWSPAMFWKFTNIVRKRRPIAVIATHIVAANCAVAARMLSEQTFPVVCVPTDYAAEGFWPHTDADLFCAADDIMVQELLPRLVPPEHIVVTGIPVRQGFSEEHNTRAIRKRFGLPQDKMIVLVMAGAKSSEPYVPFRKVVEPLFGELPYFQDMHFVFLAGEDCAYAENLRHTFQERGITNVSVCNYVEEMVDLMSASNLIIAKSGGLAITECICARLPMILVGKPYGQERVNTYAVEKMGVALKAETTKELIEEIRRVHQTPYVLEQMKEREEQIRRPFSAFDVSVATLDLVGNIVPPHKHFIKVYFGNKPFRGRWIKP